jgi:hypothetical protein
MNDLDHMLNGKGSRQHLQNAIREAQQAKFVREVKSTQHTGKVVSPLRTILVTIINLVMR